MKLVHVYNVVKDEHFLVELVDDQLTLNALKNVVQDRGIRSQHLLTNSKLDFKMASTDCSTKTGNLNAEDCLIPLFTNPSKYSHMKSIHQGVLPFWSRYK